MALHYVYGPVPSRRLGRSLGINPVPFKTCNHSCVYCQLGRTSFMTNRRRDFFPASAILDEISRALQQHRKDVDYVTFCGEGEPTLCRSLGHLIRKTKAMTELPIAVITNGSLLYEEGVRECLVSADLVMPSLDAGDQETFKAINRPHKSLQIENVIEGMARFRKMFRGRLWIEVMLVREINDRMEALLGIRHALERIQPDRVFFNTPQRPPAEDWVRAPDGPGLIRADFLLGDWECMDRPESGEFSTVGFEDPIDAVLMIIRRHPMRWNQIRETLPMFSSDDLAEILSRLESAGEVQRIEYLGHCYYLPGEARRQPSRQALADA